MGRITNRGIMWELLNSWWMLLSIVGATGFAFIYIGIKAKKSIWTIIGIIYQVLGWGCLILLDKNMAGPIALVAIIIGIILSFKFRKEYLIRLDLLQKANVSQIENDNLRNQLAEELLQSGIIVDSSGSRKTEEIMDAEKDEFLDMNNIMQPSHNETHPLGDSMPIDINLCSIESLSELPGITMILAKKAINYRNENNGFTSVEEFYKVIELKPHFIAQIDNRLICNKPADSTRSADNSQVGRNLDL